MCNRLLFSETSEPLGHFTRLRSPPLHIHRFCVGTRKIREGLELFIQQFDAYRAGSFCVQSYLGADSFSSSAASAAIRFSNVKPSGAYRC